MKNKLTEFEKQVFNDLRKDAKPDSNLRDKIIRQLKMDGLIDLDVSVRHKFKFGISVAASILMLLLGVYIGQKSMLSDVSEEYLNPVLGYALILYEDDGFIEGNPSSRASEYRNWMKSTKSNGVYIEGQELENLSLLIDENGLVRSANSFSVQTISGYFLIEAESIDEAVDIAKSIPHVKYGGYVGIKKIITR